MSILIGKPSELSLAIIDYLSENSETGIGLIGNIGLEHNEPRIGLIGHIGLEHAQCNTIIPNDVICVNSTEKTSTELNLNAISKLSKRLPVINSISLDKIYLNRRERRLKKRKETKKKK